MIYQKQYVENLDEQQFIDRFKEVYRDLKIDVEKHGFKMNWRVQVKQNYSNVQVYQQITKPDLARPYYNGPVVHILGITFKRSNTRATGNKVEYTEETYLTSKNSRLKKNYINKPEEMLPFILL
jgi:hypothetical protein